MSLDGFRVPLRGIQSGIWTGESERNQVITAGLMDSKKWDLPNRVPLGYLARQDASGRENRFTQATTRQTPTPSLNQSLVPLRCARTRQAGATTEGIHLWDKPGTTPMYRGHELHTARTRVPLKEDGYRYHPYRSTSLRL